MDDDLSRKRKMDNQESLADINRTSRPNQGLTVSQTTNDDTLSTETFQELSRTLYERAIKSLTKVVEDSVTGRTRILNIPNIHMPPNMWAINANGSKSSWECTLNLDTIKIASIIPGYETCNTLKILVNCNNMSVFLFRSSDSFPLSNSCTYLQHICETTIVHDPDHDEDDDGDGNDINAEETHNFLEQLGLFLKSDQQFTIMPGNSGVNPHMPFKLAYEYRDLSDTHDPERVRSIKITIQDIQWDAKKRERINIIEGHYSIKESQSNIKHADASGQLFVSYLQNKIHSDMYIIAISYISGKEIVDSYGFLPWEQGRSEGSVIRSVYYNITDKLLQDFIQKFYADLNGIQLKSKHTQLLREIDTIVTRIARLQ